MAFGGVAGTNTLWEFGSGASEPPPRASYPPLRPSEREVSKRVVRERGVCLFVGWRLLSHVTLVSTVCNSPMSYLSLELENAPRDSSRSPGRACM